jgi:hypothetical protein
MTEKVICPISKSEAEATTSACLMVLGFVAKLTVNLRSQMAHWQCTKTQKLRAGRALLGAQRTGRNVVANYPFERSHRFPGIKPNSGHRDYSPLSCGGGETQLGPSAEISAGFLERGARSLRRIAAIAKNFCRSRDDPAGQLGNTIAHFALDFSRQESVCGGHGQRACGLLLSPASALRPPRGLGGGGAILRRHDGEEFLHVQAQAWANYQEGFI